MLRKAESGAVNLPGPLENCSGLFFCYVSDERKKIFDGKIDIDITEDILYEPFDISAHRYEAINAQKFKSSLKQFFLIGNENDFYNDTSPSSSKAKMPSLINHQMTLSPGLMELLKPDEKKVQEMVLMP